MRVLRGKYRNKTPNCPGREGKGRLPEEVIVGRPKESWVNEICGSEMGQ
jgi:hypothetical protein